MFVEGQILVSTFEAFTSRITFHARSTLSVEIVKGENVGFSDTVPYEAITLRDGLVVLSWQEHIGSTIVHVLDLQAERAYTVVTPAKGGFLRLQGSIRVTNG